MIKTSSKILQRWLLLWSKNSPLPLNDILDPFFIQCRGPQCQLMWLVYLKEMVFTLCIYDSEDTIWFIENTALTFFFCTKWDLRVLNSSPKSMNWELPFVVLNWDQALLSFRFVNNIPASMAKRMRTAQIGHDLRLSSFVLIDFGVRLSRIHFSPTVRGGEMNAWQTSLFQAFR